MKITNFILLLLIFTLNLYAQETKKLSIQLLWKHQFEFAGFYMAKEKGFYKKYNIDLKLKEYNFGDNITNDVESQKSTFGIGYPSLILDRSNGSKIVLLNAILQNSPHVLVTLKSSNINSIKDFKNKKIKLLDSEQQTAAIKSMLYSNNILYKDLDIIKYRYDINDLINHKVDITAVFLSNEIYTLKQKNIQYNVWNPKDYGFDFYDDILFTSSKFLKEDPVTVKNFQKATIQGWEYAFSHIDETIDLILKKYNSQHKTRGALHYEAKILKELAYKDSIPFGHISKTKIQRIYDIYNLIGLVKNPIKLDNFIFKPNDTKLILTQDEYKYLNNKKNINMCIDPDWMPFEKFENGDYIGISSDYFKLFKNILNVDFNVIKTNNWTQSLEYAKNRKCDILSLAMETNSRKKYMNFTEPYLKIPLVIATKKNVPFISDLANLKNKKVAIPKGYAFIEILKNKYPSLIIVEVENINDGLNQVKRGDVFGYIGTIASIGYMFQTKFNSELKIAGKFDEKWKLGIAVRSDDKVLLNILNKTIKSIDSPTRQKILNNWVSIKYEKNVDKEFILNILIIIFIIIIFFLYKQYLLKKSIKEFNDVINATMESILIFKDGICIDANQSTIEMFGYSSKDEIIGKDPLSFIAEESSQYVKEQMKKPSALPYEAKVIKKDGTEFYALLRGQNLKSRNVRLSSVIDISKIKLQEKTLIEQSRMAAMGEMIGNIAHQWRQPLSVISTGATGLQLQKEYGLLTDEIFEESCNAINKNAQYLSKTIDDFKNFIKGDRKKQKFNLNENIDSFIKLIDGTVKTNFIKLFSKIDDTIYLYGYPNELIQCYINIFNNAKDVLKEIEDMDRLIFINCYIQNNSIIISIKDNGGGIPDDIILKIFDPYFTTKHKSQGTGLGLHMTYNLINDGMNGNITVHNVEYKHNNKNYKGAEFKIILPQQEE